MTATNYKRPIIGTEEAPSKKKKKRKKIRDKNVQCVFFSRKVFSLTMNGTSAPDRLVRFVRPNSQRCVCVLIAVEDVGQHKQ